MALMRYVLVFHAPSFPGSDLDMRGDRLAAGPVPRTPLTKIEMTYDTVPRLRVDGMDCGPLAAIIRDFKDEQDPEEF